MKKMIRIGIGLLLLGTLVFVCFRWFGPGNRMKTADNSITVKRIVMWKFKSNKEDYIIYDWIKEWNDRHPEVQVSLELIPFTDYLDNKLPTAFATNSAPDIYLISAGGFLKYAKAGCMLPLNRYFPDDLKKDFYKQSLEAATYHGKIMGIPIEREPVALFYNKKVFKEKGLTPPQNWDDLLLCAQKLQSSSMSGIYLPVLPNDYQNFIFESFLVQVSDTVVNGKPRIFRKSGYKALELWRNLAPYNYNGETAVQHAPDIYPLAAGKTAMQVCGYWAVKMLEKYYPKFEYGVVPVPVLTGGIRRSVYGGWFQVINPGCKYKDEAVAFSLWMWGSDTVRPAEWCTVASSKFPARVSVVTKNEKLFNHTNSIVFKDQILPYAVPELRFPSEVSNAISKAIQNTLFTNKPIEDIAAKADEEINRFLKL